MSNRFDPVATVTVTTATGSHTITVNREDVTTTNGAYRAIVAEVTDTVTGLLGDLLAAHRSGATIAALPEEWVK